MQQIVGALVRWAGEIVFSLGQVKRWNGSNSSAVRTTNTMQSPPGTEVVPNAGGGKDGLPAVPIDELDFDFVGSCSDTKKLRDILTILESGKEGHYPELIQATIDQLLKHLPANEKKLFLSLRSKPSASEEAAAKDLISDWVSEISKKDAAVAASASAAAAAAANSHGDYAAAGGGGVGGGGGEDSASGEIFAEAVAEADSDQDLAKVYASRVPVRNQVAAGGGGGGGAAAGGARRQQLGSSTASIHSNSDAPRWTEAKPDPKARDFKSYYEDWDKFDPEEARLWQRGLV